MTHTLKIHYCYLPYVCMLIETCLFITLDPPSIGLYFMLNGIIYLPGDSILISDIGPQPFNRRDPGSTLVCVTTNVNTACCRDDDNPSNLNTGGAIGEWYYPNTTEVPSPSENVINFARFGYTHHVRLARVVSDSTPPPGVYTCQVPLNTNVIYNASITIQNGKFIIQKNSVYIICEQY